MASLRVARDTRVVAEDGDVGGVRYVIADPVTHEVTHIVVEHEGHEWLFPIGAVRDVDEQHIFLQHPWTAVPGLEQFDSLTAPNASVSVRPTASARLPGAPLMPREEDPRVIRLHGELLEAHTQWVAAGDVLVGKTVTSEPRKFDVPFHREEIIVEHRPVEPPRPAASEVLGDQQIHLVVHAEEVRLEKKVVPIEIVRVAKRTVEDVAHKSGTVHRETLHVESTGGAVVREQDSAPSKLDEPTPVREGIMKREA